MQQNQLQLSLFRRLVYDRASLQVRGLAHSPQFQDSSTQNILRSKKKMNEFIRCKIGLSHFVVYVKLFLSVRVVENMQAITTIYTLASEAN